MLPCYLIILLLCLSAPALARDEWVHHVNRNFLRNIAAKNNQVWVTGSGVIKWDLDSGEYTWFTTKDSLPDNWTNQVEIDSRGHVWVSFPKEVGEYDGTKWIIHSDERDGTPISSSVFDIVADRWGYVWFVDGSYIISFDGIRWNRYRAGVYVWSIGIDNSGIPWVFLRPSLLKKAVGMTYTEWPAYDLKDVIYEQIPSRIRFDDDNNVWIASATGAIKFDGNQAIKLTKEDGLPANSIHDILFAQNRNCWVATYEGAGRSDGISWITHTDENGLTSRKVNSLDEDESGNIWLGTNGGGINKYDGENWSSLVIDDWLPHPTIGPMAVDKNGILWFGTGNCVAAYDGSKCTTYTTNDGLSSNVISCIAVDKDNNKWVGYGDNPLGVDRFDGNAWLHYAASANGLANSRVFAISPDHEGNVWFATNFGVSKFDGQTWMSYSNWNKDGLVNDEVRSIAVDREGNVWFGTYRGISRFNGMAWTNFDQNDGLPLKEASAICVDSQNNVWIAFHTRESIVDTLNLYKFNGSSWTEYPVFENTHKINSIMADFQGNLWFATASGLKKFDGLTWRTYTYNDGLFTMNLNSMAQDSSGNVWFGSVQGLSMLKTKTPTSVNADRPIPMDFCLYQNYPNPFNPETHIRYQLPSPSHVVLKIYNILGQEIRLLINSDQPTGSHEIRWDGTDNSGNRAASGIYIYRIKTDKGFRMALKMVLVR